MEPQTNLEPQNVGVERPAVRSTDLLDAWEKARNEHVAAAFKDAPETEGPMRQILVIVTRESFDEGFRAAVRAIGF